MATKRKKNPVNLETKYRIIQDFATGKYKQGDIADKYGLKSQSHVSKILKNRGVIVQAYESNFNSQRQTLKGASYPELDEKLIYYINSLARRGAAITEGHLKEAAKAYALDLNIKGFKASKGYIEKFKQRNSISRISVHEEGFSTPETIVAGDCTEISDLEPCEVEEPKCASSEDVNNRFDEDVTVRGPSVSQVLDALEVIDSAASMDIRKYSNLLQSIDKVRSSLIRDMINARKQSVKIEPPDFE